MITQGPILPGRNLHYGRPYDGVATAEKDLKSVDGAGNGPHRLQEYHVVYIALHRGVSRTVKVNGSSSSNNSSSNSSSSSRRRRRRRTSRTWAGGTPSSQS